MSNDSLTVELPMPPSVWKLYQGHGKRRHKSTEYKNWLNECGWRIAASRDFQWQFKGKVEVTIRAQRPDQRRRDIDNIIKAPLDLLTRQNIIKDDSQVTALDARWVEDGPNFELTVRAA